MSLSLGLPYGPTDLPRLIKSHVPLKALRDLGNRARFGWGAPLSDEPIFFDPATVTRVYHHAPGAPRFRRRHSGLVAAGDWDLSVKPIRELPKIRALYQRYRDGLTWEQTGIIDVTMDEIARKGSSDGLRSRAAVLARYASIDRLYDQIRAEGRMRARAELPDRFRREYGGVFVHVTRTGEVVRAGGGIHRFEIARILGLPQMPAQLGVIHRDAVAAGHLDRLRAGGRG